MKKTFISIILVGLFISTSPAMAATKASSVTAAFKTLLNSTADAIDALEQKYESDLDSLDASLAKSTLEANNTYTVENSAASNLYLPQIATTKF